MDEEFVTPWKNGDILVIRTWIIIFCGVMADINHAIVYHALCNLRDIDSPYPYTSLGRNTGIGYYIGQEEDFRYATNYERKKFFDRLAEKGAYWDSETLRLKDKNGELIRGRIDNLNQ